MAQFPPLAERIIDALLARSPALAQSAGVHAHDDRLPDFSASAVAAEVTGLRSAADALAEVDTDALDPADRVDHELLSSLVDHTLFERTEVREHEWNPVRHNPGPLLHALLARDFAPVEVRLGALAARLAVLPDALATARATLVDCPRIHLETAAEQFAGTAELLRGQVPAALAGAPGLSGQVTPLAEVAAAELDGFVAWLREQVATGEPGRDPRLGRRLFEARLWHTLDTEMSAAELLRLAWERLDAVTAELRATGAELVGGPPTDTTVRLALDRLSGQHPDDSSIVALAGRAMAEATGFTREHDLVSLVDDPCVIEEMPEFARGVAVAYCDAPGSLEPAGMPTFFCIAPPPAGWAPDRVASFYREYNDHMIRNLTVHEAMPGHYLQLAHSRRYAGRTRVRALTVSGSFVEGWAVYAEEMMTDAGFGGAAVRAQRLKLQLRMIVNALLDQLVHAEGLTEAEGMALMTGRGFQEEGEAAGKWRRALLTSTQLSTYFVGYLEVAAIAAARPAGTPVRAWHDAMLGHGSPSPRHLATLLAVADARVTGQRRVASPGSAGAGR